MKFRVVNKKKDKRIMARMTRTKDAKNTTLTNTRGGVRM